MTSNEFQGILYRSPREMCDGVADAWLTAGGLNDAVFIRDVLERTTADKLADEVIEAWGFGLASENEEFAAEREERKAATWMDERGIDRDDIVAAFERYEA